MSEADWHDAELRTIGVWVRDRKPLLLWLNAEDRTVTVRLPEDGGPYAVLLDTWSETGAEPCDDSATDLASHPAGASIVLPARNAVVLGVERGENPHRGSDT